MDISPHKLTSTKVGPPRSSFYHRQPPESDNSPHLAISYCLMVISVSSMVLLQSVLMEETKKLSALSSVRPFLCSARWVVAL